MTGIQGLLVLVGVLVVAAVGALLVADRSLAPARGLPALSGDAQPMLRRGAVRAVASLAAAAVALVGVVGGGIALGGLDPVLGFSVPLVAVGAGLLAFAAVPAHRSTWRPVSTASLVPRRPWRVAPLRWLVACGVLAALAVLLLIGAALLAAPVAAFTGPVVGLAVLLVAALLAAAWAALRRIALLPAPAGEPGAVESAVRGTGGRSVLLLTACALLAFDGLVGLQAGEWLWETGPLIPGSAAAQPVGVLMALVGGAAATGVLPTAIAAVVTTSTLCRAALRSARPEPERIP